MLLVCTDVGRRNASSCCQTQRVPRRCGHLCTGHSGQLMVSDIHCLQHLPAIARCFHDVFGTNYELSNVYRLFTIYIFITLLSSGLIRQVGSSKSYAIAYFILTLRPTRQYFVGRPRLCIEFGKRFLVTWLVQSGIDYTC